MNDCFELLLEIGMFIIALIVFMIESLRFTQRLLIKVYITNSVLTTNKALI